MAGTLRVVMLLLSLLPLIQTVQNGVIQSKLTNQSNSCTLQTNKVREDIGEYRCQQRPDTFSQHNTLSSASETNVTSLQCALLGGRRCTTTSGQRVQLQWVDENGNELQDSSDQLRYRSKCNVTLTVGQTLENQRFRCKATVGIKVQTSQAFPISMKGRGKGRGIIHASDPEQGGNQDAIGAGVGVGGCVVLTALAALFVVKRRRANSLQLHDDTDRTTCDDYDGDADDVIYADIILPTRQGTVRHIECQSTEYACVRIM
ncbi:uncharacterized protein LOC142990149 isoform X2 [Genypterus blacodes]|uniref:uncharacterized protein LOC142990149 isoform X2 n=1 Tax=Genypterus blacodes TaxID=154954 RepID=UPI003F75D141